jgi:type I restriction enzyme R subunit
VDRPRSVQIVRKLSEHFSDGHRKALIHMATGTGKTRVAMAITKVLIDSNLVRNVLFLADRTALVNQAMSKGYKQFFTEPVTDLREEANKTGTLYVSTIQSMMNPQDDKLYRKYSPGFFDLIIFDEAHRSYYDRQSEVFQYFDAIKVGLTATPSSIDSHDTYEMFDCEYPTPTVQYPYDEAVRDGVLVTFQSQIVETQVLKLGIKGSELDDRLKTQLMRQELDPETTEFAGPQFARVFMDDKTNELIIHEFMNICYKSDEGKPCKSIFFCASQEHAQHMKDMFGKLFPRLSNDVQVITSNMARAQDEVKRFMNESEPRIALSVGMLDTGIDVPEVCNLVFVRPVFSSIRFWQMLGRGTRNFESCKHPDWLPSGRKDDFLILDFKMGGVSSVQINLKDEKSKQYTPGKDTNTKIFEKRVGLLKKELDKEQKELITGKVAQTIDELDMDSFIIREKIAAVEKMKANKFNLDDYIQDLYDDISPLIVTTHGIDPRISSFILKVEGLFYFVLERKLEQIGEVREYVEAMVLNVIVKDNLDIIRNNRDKLMRVLQPDFWEDLTFNDVEYLVREIAPLMRFYEKRGEIVLVDKPDIVLGRETYVKEIKEDEELKAFLNGNPLARKIKDGQGITSFELMELEKALRELRPEMTIENIQKRQGIDFIQFLWEIIGLTREEDPRALIESRFDEFIIQTKKYNSKQLDFLISLKKVFAVKKHLVMPDFGHSPIADWNPLDKFTLADIEEIVEKCDMIRVA